MKSGSFPLLSLETGIKNAQGLLPTASVSAQATDDHPAIIKLGLQNDSDSVVELEFGFAYPFDSLRNEEGPATVFLIPVKGADSMLESGIPDSLLDQCWKFDGELVIPQSGMDIQLDPEESIEREYALLMPPYSDVCFPSGKYVYATTFSRDVSTGKRKAIEWRVTVNLFEEN